MNRPWIPDEVLAAAQARARARAARDWTEADRLRAEIEAAGWTIVDRGAHFALAPAHPPDVVDGARIRYGSSAAVPSRLDEAPVAVATVVLIATDWPADLERALSGIRLHAPDATQVVIAAAAPSPDQEAALAALEELDPGGPGLQSEVAWLSARLGRAAAINAACRRASGHVILLLDSSLEPTGDVISPLVAALDDPTVALAGGRGLATEDLRRFTDISSGEAVAIDGSCLAFRRADVRDRGPLDEQFRSDRYLDAWWSLVLRDEGEGEAPRRAVVVERLPLTQHEPRLPAAFSQQERDRLDKRGYYRILERFRDRDDLLSGTRA